MLFLSRVSLFPCGMEGCGLGSVPVWGRNEQVVIIAKATIIQTELNQAGRQDAESSEQVWASLRRVPNEVC